jgi:hypothetical protein
VKRIPFQGIPRVMLLQVMGAWLTLGTISESAEAVKLRVETVSY